VPGVAFEHRRQKSAYCPEQRHDVDRERTFDIGLTDLEDTLARNDAGIVHENVDRTTQCQRIPGDRRDHLAVGNIAGIDVRSEARFEQLFPGALQSGLVDVPQHELGARTRQLGRQQSAYAACGASDERTFPKDVGHTVPGV